MREHRQKLVGAAIRSLELFGLVTQLLLDFRKPQQRAHGGDELLLLEGMAEVAIGAAFETLHLELSGDENR